MPTLAYPRSQIMQKAHQVLDRLRKVTPGDGSNDHLDMNQWEWPQGVALYGLWQFAGNTGSEEGLDYIRAWFDAQMAKPAPVRDINSTAPLLTLAFLAEKDRRPEHLALVEDWAAWVIHDLPKTEESGFQHITAWDANEQQLWDDTLFMTVLFLAKAGQLLKREDYVQEAIRQFLLHIKYLADRKTGLLFHAWTFKGHHHFAGALWARGNCWFTAAVPELLGMISPEAATTRFLADALEAQVKALAACQNPSGIWPTLLDDPASYEETSAAAGFAYGILKGIRLGVLPESWFSVAQRAVDGVMAQIDDNGTVLGVSYGTAVGDTLEHYRNIPLCPTAYGQGLTFLMLTEVLHWTE